VLKVLFICRADKGGKVNPAVMAQAKSLRSANLHIDIYPVTGSSLLNYIRALIKIIILKRSGTYDLFHAHYGLCGIVTFPGAGKRKTIVSLMGSEVHHSLIFRVSMRFFSNYFWGATIVKSEEMRSLLGNPRAHVIPNGVDMKLFKPVPLSEARLKINVPITEKIVLFPSGRKRMEKNFSLATKACELLDKVNLVELDGLCQEDVAGWLNASNALLLTSSYEGSPNIIKEALACNTPIVSVNVGDVEEIISGVKECYITGNDPEVISESLKACLSSGLRPDGTRRIIKLGLDSETIALKVKALYKVRVLSL
jgi:teichuronic acid biosynthesis glycosyltransferase TuaC